MGIPERLTTVSAVLVFLTVLLLDLIVGFRNPSDLCRVLCVCENIIMGFREVLIKPSSFGVVLDDDKIQLLSKSAIEDVRIIRKFVVIDT